MDGTKTFTVFDAAGRRVAETNQDWIVTLFGYDGAGRLSSVTNAFGKPEQMVTRYLYDEAGNQTAQIDGLSRTNRFEHDKLGRRVARWLADGTNVERFAFDPAGNQVRHTNFNGAVITNEFDDFNRLTNRSSAGGYSVAFAYSPTGQRTNMVDASGVTGYEHDLRGRLRQKTVAWANGPTITLNYGRDLNGNLANLWSSTASGVTNFYQYDSLNRLTNVAANGSAVAGYGFDSVGNLQSIRYANNVTNHYRFDSLHRLTNVVWKLNTTTLGDFTYWLGLTGNRTNLSETVNGTSRAYAWQHDALYRLTNEVITGAAPTGAIAYCHDLVGNRTNRESSVTGIANQTLGYGANDWLTTDTYDNNGSTVASGGDSYAYDVEARLTNATVGGTAVSVGYNGDGARVRKTVGATTIFYLTDDQNPSGYVQVLEEHVPSTINPQLSTVAITTAWT